MHLCETSRGLAADLIITLPYGVHSRPAARLAKAARAFEADILLIGEEGEVNAKSMLDILTLALKPNDSVRLLARGNDAREAILTLAAMLAPEAE